MEKKNSLLPWLLGLLVLLPLPLLMGNPYQIRLLDIICINIIMAVGLNIVKGFAGQVTIGHVGLQAIGAYTSAILARDLGLSFWFTFPLAILVASLAGVVVGFPSLRLEGAYLALATLGMGESVRIFISVTGFLGSSQGIGNIPRPQIGSFVFNSPINYYYLLMPIMLIGLYFSFALLRSSVGRAFKAVREDPLSASASGVNVTKYKLIAFVISAAYAGAGGSLYAHLNPGFIHPNDFTIIEMVKFMLMVVLGGLGNIWGGVLGAILVTVVFDLTRDYFAYQMLIFGGLIVGTVLFMPKGIGGFIDRFLITRAFARKQSAS